MKKLYYNGTILTMDSPAASVPQTAKIAAASNGSSADAAYRTGCCQTVEAVLTEDGRVTAAGSLLNLSGLCDSRTERCNLEHTVLLPSFLDAHSHISAAANAKLQVPLTDCTSVREVIAMIQEFARRSPNTYGTSGSPSSWILAAGYDHNRFPDKHHLTLAELDAASPDAPLVIAHQSGHLALLNSRALMLLGITAQTTSPEGGRIGMENGELTGCLEENAFFFYQKKIPMPGIRELLQSFDEVQREYASYGITSVQEGLMVKELLPLYQKLVSDNRLRLDVTGYTPPEVWEDFTTAFPDSVRHFSHQFRLGGIKIFLDGSPQARTAWMQTPYKNSSDYGYPTMTDHAVQEAFEYAATNGLQLLAHCNGDAAAAQLIKSAKIMQERGFNLAAIRPVMIHAQLIQPAQLAELKKLSILPSFFAAHLWHWGDAHIANLGKIRADSISPMNSALQQNIIFTMHQDTPVIAPDMLESIWCAVNRRTHDGILLGSEERIPVYEALRAVTTNTAYQYFDENLHGRIRPGMAADFVILNQNPLLVPSEEIRSVKVVETIRQGKCIYRC